MIKIEAFAKNKKNNNIAETNRGFSNIIINSNNKLKPLYIWGQYFDGTSDIDGDINIPSKLTAKNGNIDILSANTLSATNATFDNINSNSGNIASLSANTFNSNSINADNIITSRLSGNNANFISLSADTFNYNTLTGNTINANIINSNSGNIKSLSSNTFNSNSIVTNSLKTDTENVKESTIINANITNGTISNIISDNANIKQLTITDSAHFYQLMIDKVNSTTGQIIISPSNGKIHHVEKIGDNYKCYIMANDENLKTTNTFEIDDMIVCQTFNAAEGDNFNSSNKFYWRKIIEKSTTPIKIDNKYYHYILLSDSDKSPNTNAIPIDGDEVITLGNKSNKNRQSAIILSSYNSVFLDDEISAPSIVQYDGINEYNLKQFRLNTISKNLNQFIGKFKIENGKSIEELIKEKNSDTINTPYIGTDGYWYNWDSSQKKYIKTNIKGTGTDGRNGVDGKNGKDANLIKFIFSVKNAFIDKNKVIETKLIGQIVKVIDGVPNVIPNVNNIYQLELASYMTGDTYKVDIDAHGNFTAITNIGEKLKSNAVTPTVVLSLYLKGKTSLITRDVIPYTYQSNTLFEVADGINAKVEGNKNNISQLTINSNKIQTTVEEVKTNITNNYLTTENVKSYIEQQSNVISIAIINKVGEKLKKVGIDINNEEINLIANKTNFIDDKGVKFITVSKDERGMPHFIFYDITGQIPCYDLGYKGLEKNPSHENQAYWDVIYLAKVDTILDFYPKTRTDKQYFQFFASYDRVTHKFGENGDKNGNIYIAKSFNRTIDDGWYIDGNLNGNYLSYRKKNPNNENEEFTIITINCKKVKDGNIIKYKKIFIKVDAFFASYCDESGNDITVDGDLIENYPERIII